MRDGSAALGRCRASSKAGRRLHARNRCTGFRAAISGHRYYNPDTGRWLSRDPLNYERNLEIYSFTRNSPISYFDVLGLVTAEQVLEVAAMGEDGMTQWIKNNPADHDEMYNKLRKENSQKAQQFKKAQKVARVRHRGAQRGGRNGFVSLKLLNRVSLISCLGACTTAYNSCLDTAQADLEDELGTALYMRDHDTATSRVDTAETIFLLDAATCAGNFVNCSASSAILVLSAWELFED